MASTTDGSVDAPGLVAEEAFSLVGNETRVAILDYECENCRYWRIFSLERFLYDRPVVVSFFFERGVDLVERWHETASYVLTYDYDVVSETPLVLAVRLPLDGDELRITLETSYESTEPFDHYGGNLAVYRESSLSVVDWEVFVDVDEGP